MDAKQFGQFIAGILVIGVAAAAWATKIANVGGGLVLGGLTATVFVSLWYFFQNIDDEESRRIYGAASVLSIGIVAALVNYVWGDRIAEWIPGGVDCNVYAWDDQMCPSAEAEKSKEV